MRVDKVDGWYVKYRDSGQPTEFFDHVSYAFRMPDRTCLVTRADHLRLLLSQNRFDVVGVEIESPVGGVDKASQVQIKEVPPTMKRRPGRPRRV